MKIIICDEFAPSLPAKLTSYGKILKKEELAEAEVALVRSKTKCNKEWIDKAKSLKMIIRGGVGVDNIDMDYAKTKNIIVKNTPEASSISVAELAIALMLAIPNHIIKAHNGMVGGKWLKKECERTELYGKTLGLIGIGRIGTEVAKRAKVFGMKVIAYDKYVSSSDLAECKKTLDEVLAQSDYISLHTPSTPETQKMINKDTIAKMKNGVILINTCRGEVVVEQDIADALKSGKIRGYGNDVWYSDPPENSPLTAAPNVVLTPHIGASSDENLLRIGDVVEKILTEYNKEMSKKK